MRTLLIILYILIFQACAGDKVYAPKPRMYPRVFYPDKKYVPFETDYCNLTFEMPEYTDVEQEKLFFEEAPPNPCWFDLKFRDFNGNLYFSYYAIGEDKSFDELIRDAFTFVEKHDIKANYRSETLIKNDNGASGILFDIEGQVATPVQFFLTDSTRNFIRASLYFDNKVDPDSMAPVYDFVRQDVLHIIETFSFQ